jgi:hypothetical protein
MMWSVAVDIQTEGPLVASAIDGLFQALVEQFAQLHVSVDDRYFWAAPRSGTARLAFIIRSPSRAQALATGEQALALAAARCEGFDLEEIHFRVLATPPV